jgi:hypothetical protein
MAKLDLTVEINDESLLAAVAEVEEKRRELNGAIFKLRSIVTGEHADINPNGAVVKEMPQG